MSLNIHPIIVHFPIALLTLYALLEISSLFIRKNKDLGTTKLFLLFIGELGAVVAGLTGKLAGQEAYTNPDIRYPQVIHTHSFFAELTFVIFAIITLLYLAQIANRYYSSKILTALAGLSEKIIFIIPVLALIGVITLTITGALGGVVVYGPNLDPFTHLVYQVFIR